MAELQLTPLHATHLALGAKMAAFAGFDMPVSYTSIKEEHFAVREKAGLFDVSHMGEFIVKGREALDFLQKITSNDVSKLSIGQAQYSCFPTPEGGIVDDLIVYRLAEDQCSEGEQAYMLVVNGANLQKDWAWLQSQLDHDTRLIDISEQTALMALQGPLASQILQPMTDTPLDDIKFYHFTKGTVAGIDNVLISATGYTGAGGFELYVQKEAAMQLWDALLAAGQKHGLQPAGLGARDTLRLEMGYCLYGNDISDSTSPLEAGLGWITKLKKGDFLGRELFLQQKETGLSRKLMGFKVNDRRIPRQGYTIELEDGTEVGTVTSGGLSPILEQPIGMGYISIEHAKVGNTVYISTGRKRLEAVLQRPPFIEQ